MNQSTERLYKWIQAYSSWDSLEAELVPVNADGIWKDRMQQTTLAAQNEYVHFGD